MVLDEKQGGQDQYFWVFLNSVQYGLNSGVCYVSWNTTLNMPKNF